MHNIMMLTDSYKVSQWCQYPPDTDKIYSYLETRNDEVRENVFFGLQYILKEYLEGQVVTADKIDEAESLVNTHFGFDIFYRERWEYILDIYDGRLPVVIEAVEEGTVLSPRNVLVTITNTDPACYWLPNYLETLLVQVWYPSTVATYSRECKKVILKYLQETGTPEDIDFKLHDFGFRGVSSVESAGIGGLAHLTNFKGTDTMQALVLGRKYYGERMAGFSIPASEHSTMTSWKRESDAYRNMLEKYPTGLVACVSDSYDIYNACENIWGNELKDLILEREGTLVIRPDSGHPPQVVLRVLNILAKQLGYTRNKKGYIVLNPKVRIIQGDGIDKEMIGLILETMKVNGFSADNIAFGSGGKLLQVHDRDELGFAFKCSARSNGEEWLDVYKDPITSKSKASKRGRLKLVKQNEEFKTISTTEWIDDEVNYLRTVFQNGAVTTFCTLESIRKLTSLEGFMEEERDIDSRLIDYSEEYEKE